MNCNEREKYISKHFSQMTADERFYLLRRRDSLARKKAIKFSDHALIMMDERRIKQRDIIKAVREGQIMEYRRIFRDGVHVDTRITIRATHLSYGDQQVVVSLSLKYNKIITTYYNRFEDIFKDRNFAKYNKDLMILAN